MTDSFERKIGGIDVPRALDPVFRDRLEHTMTHESDAAAAGSTRWSIDGPRDLPAPARARIESAMARRRRWVLSPLKMVAAAVVVLLVASATVVVVDRVGKRGGVGEDRPFVAAPSNSPNPPPTTPSAPSKVAPNGPSTLRGFTSASQFLAYVRGEGLKLAGPYGIPGATTGGFGGAGPQPPAPPGQPQSAPLRPAPEPGHSQTNVQETGVDEPDMVKTDGDRMVLLSGTVLRLFDVRKGARLLDTFDLPDNPERLFLDDGRVIALGWRYPAPRQASSITHVSERIWTVVTVFEIASTDRLRKVSSVEIEGSYVDARLVDGVIRLAVAYTALGPQPVYANSSDPGIESAAEAENRRMIRRSTVGDWMPHYVVQQVGKAAKAGHVHDWTAVSRPPDRSGLGMLTILAIDPSNPRADNAISVVGAGREVYATTTHLYVASNARDDTVALREGRAPQEALTRIHKFDISDPKRTVYAGSGDVPGFLLNQFSMSEHDGRLRIATTTGVPGLETADPAESTITVLAEKAGLLVRVGSVGNLGRGERIYSVRFVGALGYVVTFRQVDPLYVVDLRKPSRPRVRGILKVPGYSDYLHPIGAGALLGVGRDATQAGVARGIQISLFDVSDPRNPRRLDNVIQGKNGETGLESDHHRFLYWAPRELIVVPAVIDDDPDYPVDFVGALALTVDPDTGLGRPVRITHTGRRGADPNDVLIQRSVVIGQRLITISLAGLLISDLETLDDRAWVPFD